METITGDLLALMGRCLLLRVSSVCLAPTDADNSTFLLIRHDNILRHESRGPLGGGGLCGDQRTGGDIINDIILLLRLSEQETKTEGNSETQKASKMRRKKLKRIVGDTEGQWYIKGKTYVKGWAWLLIMRCVSDRVAVLFFLLAPGGAFMWDLPSVLPHSYQPTLLHF